MSKELITLIQNNKTQKEIIEFIQSKAFDKKQINNWDSTGNTPLMLCANRGMVEAVELLITFKAKTNRTNIHGLSALAWAGLDANVKLVKLLIDKGADYNLSKNFFAVGDESNRVKAPLTYMLDHYKHMQRSQPWIDRALEVADIYLSLATNKGQVNKFIKHINASNQQDNEVYNRLNSQLNLLLDKYKLEEALERKKTKMLVNKL